MHQISAILMALLVGLSPTRLCSAEEKAGSDIADTHSVDWFSLNESESMTVMTKAICGEIDEIDSGKTRKKFPDETEMTICTKNVSFGGAKGLAVRETIQAAAADKYSPFFKPPSRSAFLKLGFTLANKDENEGFLRHVDELRNTVARTCCGENKECLAAMAKVRTTICQTLEDENQPDRCIFSPGLYNVDEEMRKQLLWNMRQILSDRGKTVESVDLPEEAANSDIKDAINPNASHQIISGEIVFSPYRTRDGKTLIGDFPIQHEFGHACSFIKRQIQAQNQSSSALRDLTKYFAGSEEQFCGLTADNGNAFRSILANSPPEVMDCVFELAKRARDPKSRAFSGRVCPYLRLEEGLAEVAPLVTGDDFILRNTKRACYQPIGDPTHPPTDLIYQCVIEHSQKFRERFRKLNCQESAK